VQASCHRMRCANSNIAGIVIIPRTYTDTRQTPMTSLFLTEPSTGWRNCGLTGEAERCDSSGVRHDVVLRAGLVRAFKI
jgi:hypothetical protein